MFNSDHIEPVMRRGKVVKGCTSVALNQHCGGKKLCNVQFRLSCMIQRCGGRLICDYISMFNSDHLEPVVRRKKVIKGCTSVALNHRCGGKSYVMFNLGCLDPVVWTMVYM